MTTDILSCLSIYTVSQLIVLLHFTMLIVSVSLLVYSVIYQRVCVF